MAFDLEAAAKESDVGVRLDFTDLTFTITRRQETKEILKNVAGSCRPGRMLAIMGRSGAGKTTLLDILACNVAEGTITGTVLVNGMPRTAAQFRAMSCYVMQKDVLLSSATVRESLMTSALLRLPYSMPYAEKVQRVDAVIAELGLQSCQDVLVGEEVMGRKGISGGQRRRLSMGIEMVTNPRMIFLDEPTSGLDSDSAYAIMKAVQDLARRQRTVVLTIHQPSSDIVDLFDDFMLLASGRCCYYGTWQDSVPAIGSFGFACPSFKNPADFYMSITKDEGVCRKLAEAFERYRKDQQGIGSSQLQLPSSFNDTCPLTDSQDPLTPHSLPPAQSFNTCQSPSPTQTCAPSYPRIDGIFASLSPCSYSTPPSRSATPTWYQILVLSKRFALSWRRDPMLFSSEAFQYVVFGTFIGLMYLQVSDYGSKGAFQRVSSIWFALTAMSFTPAMTAMVVWEKERLLLRRESAMQAYNSWSFFAAKTLVTWPVELALSAVLGALVYFMVGFQTNAVNFFLWLLVLLMFQVTSETIGVICSIITPSVAYANLILSVIMIFMLSFTGFLTQGTPIYFKWVQNISYLNYAYVSMVDVEFTGLRLRADDGAWTDARVFIPPGSTNELGLAANILIVFSLMVGTRLIALLLLNVAIRRRWL